MTILNDRPAQFLMQADAGLDYEAARARLDRAALSLELPDALTPADEAFALGLAACGRRMFRGGVFVAVPESVVCRTGPGAGRPLRAVLAGLGVLPILPPAGAFRLHLGEGDAEADLFVDVRGWTATVGPAPLKQSGPAGNVLSGLLASALALSVAFRRVVLDDVRAGRRIETLSAWGPDEAEVPAELAYLPKALWLLGLGNLGQATLFALSLLPYHDRGEVALLLQDADRVGPENVDVQVLTEPGWVGLRKTRAVANWADHLGFQTTLVERRFGPGTRPEGDDPRTALVGVDNLETRRWAAGAGFDYVLDAGLGATGPEAFDLRLHAFPGRRTPEQAWPVLPAAKPVLSVGLRRLVEQGRLDLCGAMTIAGKSVGVPCTALAAAAMQVGQVCRMIATGRCADLLDASLAATRDTVWLDMECAPVRPAFVGARSAIL